jgi:FecR protein
MLRSRFAVMASVVLVALLSAPAWGTNAPANSALPGTVNYVEGQVARGQQSVDAKSIGSAELQPGQLLTTGNGKAEILLTPGVFFRVGNNSSVKMISPSITHTELSLESGHVMVEVAEIHPENDIRITEDGVTAQLLKTGLYDFNQKQNELRVFDGKASVEDGAKSVTVMGGLELSLEANSSPKA